MDFYKMMFQSVLKLSVVLYVDVGDNRAILDNLSLSFVSLQDKTYIERYSELFIGLQRYIKRSLQGCCSR